MLKNIKCIICGRPFNSLRHNARVCPDPVCQKAHKANLNAKRYQKNNGDHNE